MAFQIMATDPLMWIEIRERLLGQQKIPTPDILNKYIRYDNIIDIFLRSMSCIGEQI